MEQDPSERPEPEKTPLQRAITAATTKIEARRLAKKHTQSRILAEGQRKRNRRSRARTKMQKASRRANR